MQAGTVVFALGNRSRGDDAIGPLLLERLATWLAAAGRSAEFELIDDYQLQIEHALDLQGRRLALFIDAGWRTPAPLEFYAVAPAAAAAAGSTHALSPQAVLDVFRQIALGEPPHAFVLCVRGERFELGAGLSPSAGQHLQAAWRQLVLLCAQPDAARWHAMAKAPVDVPRHCIGTA
jgi:hydrogenase maturation protease